MARNLEAVRTARALAEQEAVVVRIREELEVALSDLEKRRAAYRDAVARSENWV